MLRQATSGGWSIGEVAGRSMEDLRELVAPVKPPALERNGGTLPQELVADCLAAIDEMAAGTLSALLSRAMVELRASVFLDDVVARLLDEIGDRWRRGVLDPGQEHLASVAVQSALGRVIADMQPGEPAPAIGTS